MMTMHEEWTDKLSEYLDSELPDEQRYAVESHLSGCAHCTAVLADLQRVVVKAQELQPHPPHADLWAGVAERISDPRARGATRPGADRDAAARGVSDVVAFPQRSARAARRISFTLPQAVAASLVIALLSGGLAWLLAGKLEGPAPNMSAGVVQSRDANLPNQREAERPAFSPADDVQVATVGVADPQYDAAVADLENALKKGRGQLDVSTIAVVEHNLQIIDQAIDQARQALAADPANSYLSSHLFETRRRKLDLLRRAAALTSETN
jgi:anti-sigma factor RsiW